MRILIVEDEALIAMVAEDMVDAIGMTVAGTTPTVAAALAAIEAGGFDAAMLDVNLANENSAAVADALKAHGIPFLFTTGGTDGIASQHADAPVLGKPYSIGDLEAALAALTGPAPAR